MPSSPPATYNTSNNHHYRKCVATSNVKCDCLRTILIYFPSARKEREGKSVSFSPPKVISCRCVFTNLLPEGACEQLCNGTLHLALRTLRMRSQPLLRRVVHEACNHRCLRLFTLLLSRAPPASQPGYFELLPLHRLLVEGLCPATRNAIISEPYN